MDSCILNFCAIGMLSNLNDSGSLLHSRHAQLQGDCNELEVSRHECNVSSAFVIVT